MRLSPVEAAKQFINDQFPKCNVAILAGSVIHGNETEHSDLDIVILDYSQPAPYRESFFMYDWPIEIIVLTELSYHDFFEFERFKSNPHLARMCAHGLVIKDDGKAEALQIDALDSLKRGPHPWSIEEIDQERYVITDLLDDFIASKDEGETLFIANHLSITISEFILRVNGCWIGEGKWLLRALEEYDHNVSKQFIDALTSFYKEGNRRPIINFVDRILEPYGGRLFAGFSMNF